MVGKHHIVVRNKYVTYSFEIKRKYTIIRGDSATGKTYMCSMLKDISTQVNSSVPVSVLPNSNWQILLRGVSGQVFVIDENFPEIATKEFAQAMKYSDNYFILITRESLDYVPYSVREVYKLVSSKKYNNMNKAFTETTLLATADGITKVI